MTPEGYWSVALWNCRVLPKLFSCSTKLAPLPAPFLLFSNVTPFQYSSSLESYTMDVSPSVAGGSP